MNRPQRDKILEAYGQPRFQNKKTGTMIVFARQNKEDAEAIEKIKTQELVKEWKSLVWINHIYGQVSLNEMQRIDLIELEMDERKDINNKELKDWYDKEMKNQKEKKQ